MGSFGFAPKRIILIVNKTSERAAIAAQLQAEIQSSVEGAVALTGAFPLLVSRPELVIVDWSDLEITRDSWTRFQAVLRGAPALVLALQLDRQRLEQWGVRPGSWLLRPLTIGDIIKRAKELLEETSEHGRTDGGRQANGGADL
jgi:hypothetical protein